jgi:hypothetical protein
VCVHVRTEEVGRQVKEADAGATRMGGGVSGGGGAGGVIPALAYMIVFVDSRVVF